MHVDSGPVANARQRAPLRGCESIAKRTTEGLYVAERYASKGSLGETKREIFDSIRDLTRRIDQHL